MRLAEVMALVKEHREHAGNKVGAVLDRYWPKIQPAFEEWVKKAAMEGQYNLRFALEDKIVQGFNIPEVVTDYERYIFSMKFKTKVDQEYPEFSCSVKISEDKYVFNFSWEDKSGKVKNKDFM